MINIMHKDCCHPLEAKDLLTEKCPGCGKSFNLKDIACSRILAPSEMTERDIYTSKFQKLTEQMMSLARGAKTDDYGETWKRLGLMGIYVKIFIKEGRLNELIWNKESVGDISVKDESIEDTLLDMACYCLYGVISLRENNIYGETATNMHLVNMRNAIDGRLGGKVCEYLSQE